MNNKKVNWLFLCLIMVDLSVLALQIISYVVFGTGLSIGIAANFILSELMLFLPGLLFLLTSWNKPGAAGLNEMLGFRKMKLSSFFMVILFTFLIMPMTTAINAISMLFVDNAVSAISDDVLKMPFPVMLFLIGIYGPFCEEFVFRGIIYRGYKNSGPIIWSIFWSALLFGLMHMNFNQAAYAIAIGIMFALLVEATGSLWSSVIAHMIFNSEQVCLMYLVRYIYPDTYSASSASEGLTTETLLAVIGPYLIAAVAATSFAVCVLVWLAGNEDRKERLRSIWEGRKMKGGRFVSVPLIIAIVLSLGYMILDVVMTRLA